MNLLLLSIDSSRQELMAVSDVAAHYHHALFAALSHVGLPRTWRHLPSSDTWLQRVDEALDIDGAPEHLFLLASSCFFFFFFTVSVASVMAYSFVWRFLDSDI
jgi:hypothetical protein